MKICHVCNFKCEDKVELCPICGADLTDSPKEEITDGEFETYKNEEPVLIEPVLLATLNDVVSAEIFKDILTDNEIPYFCDEDEDGMKVVFGGGFKALDIYVEKAQFEQAQILYEEFMNSEAEFDGEFEFDDEEFEEE